MKSFFEKIWLKLNSIGLEKEKEYLLENMSMLIDSGISVDAVIKTILIDTKSWVLKRKLTEALENVENGSNLWEALEKTGLFSGYAISLIKIGEISGRLAENLQLVAKSQQKERSLKSKIRSAVVYPGFILSLVVILGVGIAWFILPNLSKVFSQLDIDLPLITRVLIWFGNFLGDYGYIAVPIFLVLIICFFYVLFFYKKTKHIGLAILMIFPTIKRLITEIELAKIGFIMGTMLDAGMPVLDSLNALQNSSTLRIYSELYSRLVAGVSDGKNFEQIFHSYKKTNKLIPTSVQQMIAVAYESGRLAETFKQIGDRFDEQTDLTTKNLSVILEPVLLVIVWFGVVGVALAVILPLYSLIGNL